MHTDRLSPALFDDTDRLIFYDFNPEKDGLSDKAKLRHWKAGGRVDQVYRLITNVIWKMLYKIQVLF